MPLLSSAVRRSHDESVNAVSNALRLRSSHAADRARQAMAHRAMGCEVMSGVTPATRLAARCWSTWARLTCKTLPEGATRRELDSLPPVFRKQAQLPVGRHPGHD